MRPNTHRTRHLRQNISVAWQLFCFAIRVLKNIPVARGSTEVWHVVGKIACDTRCAKRGVKTRKSSRFDWRCWPLAFLCFEIHRIQNKLDVFLDPWKFRLKNWLVQKITFFFKTSKHRLPSVSDLLNQHQTESWTNRYQGIRYGKPCWDLTRIDMKSFYTANPTDI